MSGNKSTAGNPARQIKVKSAHFWTLFTQVWRRGRDSNPRGIAPKLISSQPRYDHFDTSPCLSQHLTPEKHLGFWGELMGRTYLIFGFRSLRKPSKIKGSGVRRVHKGDTISRATGHIRTEFCKKSHLSLYAFSFNRYAQNLPSLTRSRVPSPLRSRKIRFAVAGETPRPSHRSALRISALAFK